MVVVAFFTFSSGFAALTAAWRPFHPTPGSLSDHALHQRDRYSFGNLEEVLELPDLIAVQRESFQWLLDEGLAQTFRDISPIKDFTETLQLELEFDPDDEDLRPPPKYTVENCKKRT